MEMRKLSLYHSVLVFVAIAKSEMSKFGRKGLSVGVER